MKKELDTIIEISDSQIKFVQSKLVKGKHILVSCDIRSLNYGSDDAIVDQLIDITRSKSIDPENLILVLPRRHVIIKQMRLPSQNDKEIIKMIPLQLVNKIPFALEEIVYDHQQISVDPSGYALVLVAIINKEVSERYVRLFNKINLPISKISITSWGQLEWLNYQIKSQNVDPQQTIILLNIDESSSEINFCHDKKMLFSRNVNYGANELDENGIINLTNQIELSIGAYEKDNLGPQPQKVIVVSSSSGVGELKERIEKDLSLATHIMGSFDNVLSHGKINLNQIKSNPSVSMTSVLGQALSSERNVINLTPQEVHTTKSSQLKKRQLLKTAALAVLVFLLMVSIEVFEIAKKREALAKVKERVEQTKLKVKQAREQIEYVHLFDLESSRRILVPDIIYEVSKLAPEDISFRSLQLDDKGKFTILGYAQEGSSVGEFQSLILNSPVFTDVRLEFATKRKIFNIDLTDFKITSQLNNMLEIE